MSRLMSAMAVFWSAVSSNSKASSNSRWKLPSGEKAKPGRGFSRGVEREELVGHVFERFADAGFARVPASAAKFVERRVRTFDDAVALDQVHALERNVEARVVGVAQQHEFAAAAVRFDLAQAFELADAVIDVDDEVAGFQFGEIAEESGGANFAAGALDGGSDVEEIGVAKERELGFGKRDAFGERRADQEQARRIRRRASAVKPAAASSDSPST